MPASVAREGSLNPQVQACWQPAAAALYPGAWHVLTERARLQIENRQGLESFSEILGVADGILLSRGNLGLDVAAEKMAMVQKAGPGPQAHEAEIALRDHLLGFHHGRRRVWHVTCPMMAARSASQAWRALSDY